MAAVKVVLPWSTWPIVPMFTCGLLRSNFAFAMGKAFLGPNVVVSVRTPTELILLQNGAHIRTRTGDLFLTKEVLYLLSYVGFNWSGKRDSNPRPSAWKADALAN